jgi:hypothetical protein
MCKFYLQDGNCSIRIPQPDGSKFVEESMKIRRAYQKAAESSPNFDKTKLGVACGKNRCCFAAGVFATWEQCPYFAH